jgi:arylsulfatase A-like enzyme
LEPRDVHFEVDFEPLAQASARTRSHKRGILHAEWKFIRDDMTGAVELYDLSSDPAELKNLAAEHPERCDELAGRLAAWTAGASAVQLAAPDVVLTKRQVERLRALGYAGDR